MRRYFSVAALAACVSLTLPLAGCASFKEKVPQTFHGRTIVYHAEAGEAINIMRDAERLLALHNKVKQIPDEEKNKLYRDADLNRDHLVSKKEAVSFWKEFVLQYEDQLGPLQITFQNGATAPSGPTQVRNPP